MQSDQASNLCPICFLSCKKTSSVRLGCGCSACSYCVSTWILNKITSFHYNIGDYIPCISSGCISFFSIDEVRPYLNRTMLSRIDNALLQAYLNKAVDIRRCPGQRCSYAGIITPESKCKERLECDLCKTQWSDHQPQGSKKSEIFTTLWKWVHTKKCPRCQISIQKNGGCPHMVCSKCLCQFCWYCMRDNDSHVGAKHVLYEIITPLIFIIPFLIGLAYLLVSFYNVPAVKTFADTAITPAVLFIINGITWAFLTFWKLGVASLFDLALRILLFAKPLINERKALCIMIMACCLGVTCYYGAYQGVFYALMIETTVVSLIKWIVYVKKMKPWEWQKVYKKLY